MGVLRMARTKSSATASARSPVCLARITSTSIIFSTGEKKWMPMNCSGRDECDASPVIGSVEVFEAKMHSGPMAASALAMASAFTFGSSNTASTTSSQPARSA